MDNLFPHVSLYVEKGQFTFNCTEWPSKTVKKFFEGLPEFLTDSGFFENSELSTGESSEIVIPAVHHAASQYAEDSELSQEDYLYVMENFIVTGVVFVENLNAGIILCDFSGESSDEESEEWGDD
jgi:hypothetical protein